MVSIGATIRHLACLVAGIGLLCAQSLAQEAPAGPDAGVSRSVVEARLQEMQESTNLADGRHIVFVPTSPAITFGHTYIVPPERVTILDTALTTVVNALTQWGAGAQEIYQPDDENN